MSSATYDQKNDELFEAVTHALNSALRRIENDLNLSVSVAELARQAKVHRNTIYHRKWPLERLALIKAQRTQQKLDQAALKTSEASPQELLAQSRLEVIYWFTELQEARASVHSLSKRNKETETSRDFYMRLAKERLDTVNEQATLIRKLEDALALLESEVSSLKGGALPG